MIGSTVCSKRCSNVLNLGIMLEKHFVSLNWALKALLYKSPWQYLNVSEEENTMLNICMNCYFLFVHNWSKTYQLILYHFYQNTTIFVFLRFTVKQLLPQYEASLFKQLRSPDFDVDNIMRSSAYSNELILKLSSSTWSPVSLKILGKSFEPRHEKTCLREFSTRSDSNWPAQLQKLARILKFWLYRDIILSKQRTTKALIRLRGCAGWSAPLLFTYEIRHIFSWSGSFINEGWIQSYK